MPPNVGIGEYKSSQNRIVAAYCHCQNELTLFYSFIIIHKLSTTQSKNIKKLLSEGVTKVQRKN
ncbi:MAG: hypothetical protein ACJ70X_08425 [Nitrososphaera sp.]